MESAGYGAYKYCNKKMEKNNKSNEIKNLKWLVITSLIITSPMIILLIFNGAEACCVVFPSLHESTFDMFIEDLKYKLVFLNDWRVQLLLATPVQFIIGARFYKRSYCAIRAKAFNGDILVTIGTTVTFFYSLYISFFGIADAAGLKIVYYESGMFIFTIVLIGKYLEEIIKGKYSKGIKNLVEIQSKTFSDESEAKYNEMIKIEQEFQNSTASIQKLVSKVCVIFVPAVILISIATFITWYYVIFHSIPYFLSKSIIYSVCVLVAACPSAIVLAIPTAIKAGVGIIAREEIGIKNGDITERISKGIKRKIVENLFLALIYNIIAISFAVTGQLTPIIAATSMSICSLIVLINSWSLKWIFRK